MSWNTGIENTVKLSFERKNGSIRVDCKNDEYYISVKNTEFSPTSSYIKLTKDEFNQIAQEIYKLWEPTNIVDALNKCGQNNSK